MVEKNHRLESGGDTGRRIGKERMSSFATFPRATDHTILREERKNSLTKKEEKSKIRG